MQLSNWKLIAGGAALVGVTAGGIAAANDDGFDLNDQRGAIELTNDGGNTGVGGNFDDGSPESADSPNESVEESADSPFDSTEDSPETADSPNEWLEESVDSPTDSPDDPGSIDPSPESADSPNEGPEDSPVAGDSPESPGSADSIDSP